jgi:hypothetical protein
MTRREVVFCHPFVLHGFNKIEPAGNYTVETEEESIDDVSFPVWRRLATIMHITGGGVTEYVRIDPEDLRKALLRDSGQAESPSALEARLLAAGRRRGTAGLQVRRPRLKR